MPAPIDTPMLKALLDYWQGKRGARALPARRDIDPLEMGPHLLPHLLLCDLFDRGTRARFRLVGTEVVRRLGFDPTGKYLEPGARGSYFELLASLHRLVYCERAPLYSASAFTWESGRQLKVQHLLLPLSHDGPDPAIALVGMGIDSGEVFPPTIRALDGSAAHAETRRFVVTPTALSDWQPRAGRKIA
jgi:hypothetical protein